MLGSRTIKTLTALLTAMISGAIVLMVLETKPIPPTMRDLAAVADDRTEPGRLIAATDVPLQPLKWRNIVIHATGTEGREIARTCHFVIGDDRAGNGYPRATALWRRQVEGYHIAVAGRDWNADSIGVCLEGDFTRLRPSRGQFQRLVALVQKLQGTCNISADHVYLHRDLDARSLSPGRGFPERAFAASLLRPAP